MSNESHPAKMSSDDKAARRRIQTACEACRATKIRCQPSEKPGVCRKSVHPLLIEDHHTDEQMP